MAWGFGSRVVNNYSVVCETLSYLEFVPSLGDHTAAPAANLRIPVKLAFR